MSLASTAIEGCLSGSSRPLLIDAWTFALHDVIAQEVFAALDVDSGRLDPSCLQLDNYVYRAGLVTRSTTMVLRCADRLLAERPVLNQAVTQAGLHALSRSQLRKMLLAVLPVLVSSPSCDAVIVASPFPAAWPLIGNQLAQRAYAEFPGALQMEWRRSNSYLLASFFHACLIPQVRLLDFALKQLRKPLLGVRGALVRLPAVITTVGIGDRPPPMAAWNGPLQLQTGVDADLIGHILYESRLAAAGAGVVHQVLDVAAPAPTLPRIGLGQAEMEQMRRSRYREYEWTALAFLALSTIERFLRSWCEHSGIPHLAGQVPQSWTVWGPRLPCSPGLFAQLRVLYDTTGPNLRNRIMHGGLLELESKRMEGTIATASQAGISGIPAPASAPDPFSTENVARLCLQCLESLDHELVTNAVSMTVPNDAWVSVLALSRQEVGVGLRVHNDFLQAAEEGEALRRRLWQTLAAVAPVFQSVFRMGFHGWISSEWTSRALLQQMFLVFSFEGLFRATAHVLGAGVLQESLSGAELRIQYRMLDGQSAVKGAFADLLVGHLESQAHREVALEVIALAIKIRNAFAHGAVPAQTEERWRGEGHLVVKAIQLLEGALLHRMTKERSYYRWLARRQAGQPDDHVADWLDAEADVVGMIRAAQ